MSNILINIDSAVVKAARADFKQRTINLTLALSLNDETLALRDQLGQLAFLESPCRVEIAEIQKRLNLKANENQPGPTVLPGVSEISLVRDGHVVDSVTLDPTTGEVKDTP